MNALTKPKEVFPSEIKNASLADGAKNWAIAGFVGGLINALVMSLVGIGGLPATGLNIVALLVGAITMAILAPLLNLIGHLILSFIAKLFGGTGSWTQHYYLMSLPALPVMVLTSGLNAIPFAGGFLSLLVSVYMLYLLTLAIQMSHGLTTLKAVAVWLIPTVILAVLMILVMGIAVLAALGSGSFPLPKG